MTHRLERGRCEKLAARPLRLGIAGSPCASSSHVMFFTWRARSGTVAVMRLPILLIALIALGAGASAFAQTGGSDQQEPEITAASVLRLTNAQNCVAPSRITVRAVPPAGVELELLRVAVEGRLATRMSGVRGRASITVRIPRGSDRKST